MDILEALTIANKNNITTEEIIFDYLTKITHINGKEIVNFDCWFEYLCWIIEHAIKYSTKYRKPKKFGKSGNSWHHIIFECYSNKANIQNNFIVLLSNEDHFMAHFFAWHAIRDRSSACCVHRTLYDYEGKLINLKSKYAYDLIINQNKIKNDIHGKIHWNSTQLGHFTNKQHSEESRKLISEGLKEWYKNHPINKERRIKMAERVSGEKNPMYGCF